MWLMREGSGGRNDGRNGGRNGRGKGEMVGELGEMVGEMGKMAVGDVVDVTMEDTKRFGAIRK